jgi:hypothetical protein
VFLSPVQKLKGSEWSIGYEVLTAVVMSSSVLWDMTPCSLLKVKIRFGGTCRFHLHDRKISEARYQHKAVRRARLRKFVCDWFISRKVTNISPSHKSLKEQRTEEAYYEPNYNESHHRKRTSNKNQIANPNYRTKCPALYHSIIIWASCRIDVSLIHLRF